MTERVVYSRFPPENSRIGFAPVLIGLARGYFADQDIDLEMLVPPAGTGSALADGTADFGAMHFSLCADPRWYGRVRAVLVHDQNRPRRGFTMLMARTALLESGRLTDDWASLQGLRIGLLAGRGDDYLAYHGALTSGGLTLDDVVAVPAAHDGDERQRALLEGDVDVVIGRGPRQRQSDVEAGLLRVWKAGWEANPFQQAQFIVASTDFLLRRPETARRWLAAYLRAVRDYCDAYDTGRGLDELVALLALKTGETPALLRAMTPGGFAPEGLIDPVRLEEDTEVLKAQELIPSSVEANNLVDIEIARHALALVPRDPSDNEG